MDFSSFMKSFKLQFYDVFLSRPRLAPSSNRTFFGLFPFLASVVLLYCFTCVCPEEGVYVVCESWRRVIKEGSKGKMKHKQKNDAKWNKNKAPDLRLRRRRGRVAFEDNSNHPPRFVFEGNSLPNKSWQLLPVSAKRLQMHVNIHRLGKPILIAFETVANSGRKDPE